MYETHDFYCLNCGRKSIPIVRSTGRLREKKHRKVLYCPWCQRDVNHIECRTPREVEIFNQRFKNGEFAEEATQSLEFTSHKGGLLL